MEDSLHVGFQRGIQADSGILYETLRVLGVGGNALTVLAVATSGPNRGVPFAIKIFRRISKPERRTSFLKEMDFLRDCNHPGVMRVFDAGVFEYRHPFFVAEYLPNTLLNVIRAGSVSMVTRISYALQLLSALACLESLDPPVIHRDIKPNNIFIKGNSCVVGDFGLIKREGARGPDDRAAMKESIGAGMPVRYRSPDQVAYLLGRGVIRRKRDVFQLGLVLAELFTGRNPARQPRRITDPVKIDRLSPIPGALSLQIANLIERMLQTNPEKRDTATLLLIPWEGVFRAAAKQANALDGRVL